MVAMIIAEDAAGQEIAPEVFDARFHLTLGLRAIRTTEPRLDAPGIRKRLEGRIPAQRRALPARHTVRGQSYKCSRVWPPK
jgi:hypothetical protein